MRKLSENKTRKHKKILENAPTFYEAPSEMLDFWKQINSMYLRIGVLLIFMLQTLIVSGQSSEQPPNSSYLNEYGISTNLFNAMINPMYQEFGSFEGKLQFQLQDGQDVKDDSFGIYYDPFYDYGLSLNLIVYDPEIYNEKPVRL